jgi:hypothetical protein
MNSAATLLINFFVIKRDSLVIGTSVHFPDGASCHFQMSTVLLLNNAGGKKSLSVR